jgi:hypothetical protein
VIRAGQVRLRAVPMSITRARPLIARWHRHLKGLHGALWAVACAPEGSEDVCGVGVVARPPRLQDDGWSADIVRVATDGTPNAPSFVLALCRRVAAVQGYRVVRTKTLPAEGGASLRAAGFERVGMTRGGSWSRRGRPREDKAPTCPKVRWEARL